MILTSPSESQKIAISKYDLLSGDFFYMNGNNWNCDFGSLTLSTCPVKRKSWEYLWKIFNVKENGCPILWRTWKKGFNRRNSL